MSTEQSATDRQHLDLAAIRAREAAATGGPWWAWDRGVGYVIALGTDTDLDEYGRPARELPEGDRTDIGRREDAEFIAHAREDIPALLAQVAAYEGAIAWDTTCLSCAAILDSSMRQTERAAARRELAGARIAGEDRVLRQLATQLQATSGNPALTAEFLTHFKLASDATPAEMLAAMGRLALIGVGELDEVCGNPGCPCAERESGPAAAVQSGTGSEPTTANCGCPISVQPMEIVDHTRECSQRRASSAIAQSIDDDLLREDPNALPADSVRFGPGVYGPPRRVVAAGLPEQPGECTGLTARWCPTHGDCTCSTEGRDGVGMDDPTCPLHKSASDHGEQKGETL